MYLSTFAKMFISSQGGWQALKLTRLSVKNMYFLVFPLSCVPPIMILFAGFNYGNNFFEKANGTTWIVSSLVFLIAELATVPLMAWIIKNIAKIRNINIEFKKTFALASIAALPMWFSSWTSWFNSSFKSRCCRNTKFTRRSRGC